jgi:hypothetical protein
LPPRKSTELLVARHLDRSSTCCLSRRDSGRKPLEKLCTILDGFWIPLSHSPLTHTFPQTAGCSWEKDKRRIDDDVGGSASRMGKWANEHTRFPCNQSRTLSFPPGLIIIVLNGKRQESGII